MKRTVALMLALLMVLTCFTSCSSGRANVSKASDRAEDEESGFNENDGDGSNDAARDPNAIDPFENLAVDFGGVSPFCTIMFNNSKCSETVQNNVVYSLQSDRIETEGSFKLGDDVTVYASVKAYGSTDDITIYPTSKTYKVENVPEYITELTDKDDLTKFKAELADSLTVYTAWSSSGYDNRAFDNGGIVGESEFKSYGDLKVTDVYFRALKTNSYDKFINEDEEADCFNMVDIMYSVKVAFSTVYPDDHPNPCVYYFALRAKNLVKYPDGTIGWGEKDPAELSFQNNYNINQNDLLNENIVSKKADYNVTKITELFK